MTAALTWDMLGCVLCSMSGSDGGDCDGVMCGDGSQWRSANKLQETADSGSAPADPVPNCTAMKESATGAPLLGISVSAVGSDIVACPVKG